MTNAFQIPKSPPDWLKKLERDSRNKIGGAARARNEKGISVPSLSNRRGVEQMEKPKC